jgi:hypothetical protein
MNFLSLINLLIDKDCIPSQTVLSKSKNHVFYYKQKNELRKLEYDEKENVIKICKRNFLVYRQIKLIHIVKTKNVSEIASEILTD